MYAGGGGEQPLTIRNEMIERQRCLRLRNAYIFLNCQQIEPQYAPCRHEFSFKVRHTPLLSENQNLDHVCSDYFFFSSILNIWGERNFLDTLYYKLIPPKKSLFFIR